MIVGTVTIYGLSALPLARYLGLADPDPQGVLIVGAPSWAIDIADKLQAAGVDVLLVDANAEHVEEARRHDLPAQQVDVLDERAIDEISFDGLGYLVTLTSSQKVNSLAALHFHEIFDSTNIYQLAIRNDGEQAEQQLPKHMRGHPLFGEAITYATISDRLDAGASIRSVSLTDEHSQNEGEAPFTGSVAPLFLVRSNGDLYVYSDQSSPIPKEGDTIIALVGEQSSRRNS